MFRLRQGGQICIVTSHAYPESIGGEETFIRQYGSFLEEAGIPYVVVSASTFPKGQALEPVHLRPFSIPFLGYELYSLLWALLAGLKIISFNSHARLGIIHSVETGYGGLAAVFAARLLRITFIVHSHGRRSETLRGIRRSIGDRRTWPYYAIERSIDRFVVRRATKAIAVSTEVATFLETLGLPPSRIKIVPSAVEIERYMRPKKPSVRMNLGIRDVSFVIGYLGRLERMKGVEVLIDGFRELVEKSSVQTLLLIAGDGPSREDLLDRVKSLNLRDVRFLGSQSDVIGFLYSLDIFVLPSFYEGSPIVLLEAMAAGCAIIASNILGVKEIAKDSILLFPPGDSGKLAEILLQVAADPELRSKLSVSAKEASYEFSTTSVFPKILAFYADP